MGEILILYYIFLGLALSLFLLGLLYSVLAYKSKNPKRIITPFNVFSVTVAVTGVCLFIPIYYDVFRGTALSVLDTILLAVHNTIRLFIVDGEFSIILDNVQTLRPVGKTVYIAFSAVIFVLAPFLTFGAVLSLFKNVFSYQKYLFSSEKTLYAFSELNEKALLLAESIKKDNPKALIVFTDVFENNEERSRENAVKAKGFHAVCFKKDITEIAFRKSLIRKQLNFVLIGSEDSENIDQCIRLADLYAETNDTCIYLFSDTAESEHIVSTLENTKVRVRRINEIQSLIYQELYQNGTELFDTAADNGEVKIISTAIVGMGQYGIELLRALVWFCQMDGYFLRVACFDCDSEFRTQLESRFPDLLNPKYNRYEITDQDARYQIDLYDHYDVNSRAFDEAVKALEQPTYVFVALGSDEKNIRTAVKLRQILAGQKAYPIVKAVVYDTPKSQIIQKAQNFKGQKWDIRVVGDFRSSYTAQTLFGTEIEKRALALHLQWGDAQTFWRYEYNYRSSVARAIHNKMKVYCQISGIQKSVAERSEAEKEALRKLEHKRWNAYMRSEGYTYAPVRNDLAKQHNCLMNFDELPLSEQVKDDE